MQIILSSLIGFLLGSIPTAYLLLKFRKGIDIRNEGSGNVGTLNSFEVTNSKKIGLTVLIVDVLKGIISVALVKYLYGDQFLLPIISLLFAVLGHCYSFWIKFKGGRGLATAAGGIIVLSPLILVFGALFWLLTYFWKKEIHIANTNAALLVIITSILFSNFLNNLSIPPAKESFIFSFCLSLLMLIILSKHWQPIKVLFNEKYDNGIKNHDEKL